MAGQPHDADEPLDQSAPHETALSAVATPQELGLALTSLLQRSGISARKAARQAGVPNSTLHNWFKGEHLPSDDEQVQALRRVLDVLGVVGRLERVGMRHGDDVIAAVDVMRVAGHAGGEVGQKVERGGADLLQGHAYPGVIKAYTLSVTQARMVNPKVIYLAAQHTPQGSAKNVMDVMDLNAAMVPWAAGITTTESPVILVDLFTGIDQKTDMSDGTHLNVSGSEKVSDRWLALLTPMFKP